MQILYDPHLYNVVYDAPLGVQDKNATTLK